jgi:hypothetical protein
MNGLLLLSDPIGCDVPLPRAIVEELLARDLVILDRVDADFFERDPLAGALGVTSKVKWTAN